MPFILRHGIGKQILVAVCPGYLFAIKGPFTTDIIIFLNRYGFNEEVDGFTETRINGLDKEIILVGQGDYFEVWDENLWQEQESETRDANANSDRFANLVITLGTA